MTTAVTESGLTIHLYGRVSSEEQADRDTIADQVFLYERWMELYGHTSGGQFLDDGVTGTLPFLDRPEGKRLVAAIRAGEVKHVVFKNVKRLGRRTRVVLDFIDLCEQNGVTLRSITEPFDTSTPIGKFIVTVLASVSELDRENILEQTRAGMRRKARNGGWLGGNRAAYGLTIEGKRHRATLGGPDLSPVPQMGQPPYVPEGRAELAGDHGQTTRAAHAYWIFEQIAAKVPALRLAETMNAMGIPSYLGKRWDNATIGAMIHNPVYKGLHRYGDGKGKNSILPVSYARVYQLVPDDLWERANKALTDNRRLSSSGTNRRYLLRGLMVCADCGAPYSGFTLPGYDETADATENRRGVLYRSACQIRRQKTGETRCPGGASVNGALEWIVWEKVCWFLAHPEQVEVALSKGEAQRADTLRQAAAQIARMTAAIEAKGSERYDVISLRRRQIITDDDLDKQLATIDAEEAILKAERERLMQQAQGTAQEGRAAQEAAAAVRRLGERLKQAEEDGRYPLDWNERRWLVERLVEKVTVTTQERRTGRRGRGANRGADVTVSFRFGEPPIPATALSSAALTCNSAAQGEGQINLLLQMVFEWHLPELEKHIFEAQKKEPGATE